MKKRIISILMSVVLLVSLMTVIISATNGEHSIDHKKNQQSIYYATRFKEKYTTIVVSKTKQEVYIEYPSDYGGMYIDENNDLHISYVNSLTEFDNNASKIKAIYDNVEYGYNYLMDIYETLSEKIIDFEIREVAIDEFNNKVTVATDYSKDAIIKYLSNIINKFDKNSVVFIQAISISSTEACGTPIKSNGSSFTLGYNARKNSTAKYGFVTCGHAVSGIGALVEKNNLWGTNLGVVKNRQFSGKIDASFIEYDNQNNKSTECMTGGNLTGVYSSTGIISGMNVCKYGSKTKYQSGKVTSTSCTIECDGITFTDQVKMDIRQEKGDSGGPVVDIFIGPLPDGSIPVNLIGIVTFADSSTWHTAWASKAVNINSAFGLSTYIK